MTNLDAPGYRLREDLHAAAQALVARRQRVARRRKRLVVAFATVALLAGGGATAAALLSQSTAPAPTTTVSTAANLSPQPPSVGPRANARAQMSVFASAPHGGQQPPEAVTRTLDAFITNPSKDIGEAVEPVQLLVNSGSAQLYAVSTARGYVCYALREPSSVGGSCAANLANDDPISATVSQAAPGDPTMIAGVATDAVASISATSAKGDVCETTVVNNGFVCATSAATPSDIHGFAVRLRDGQLIHVPF